MAASLIASKARTAFHSAAAKAEKVFTDIKKSDFSSSDLEQGEDSDNQSPVVIGKTASPTDDTSGEIKGCRKVKIQKRRPEPIKTKQDWQDRFKNIRFGKKGIQDSDKGDTVTTMSFAFFDENSYMSSDPKSKDIERNSLEEASNDSNTDIIPSAYVLKQLAVGIETTGHLKSMKDLMTSSRDSSPVRERASLSFSAVKSLVLRDKEDKFVSEFGGDEKVMSLFKSLIDAEGHFSGRKIGPRMDTVTSITSLPIHGSPPESFVVQLAEAIGSLKTLRKMSTFWLRVLAELRRLWDEEQHIPGIPPDEIPDLNSCLLYQQLQVINCCISRKRRRYIATDLLDSVVELASSNTDESAASEGTAPQAPVMYARVSSGELVLRLGADKQCQNMRLLETGEQVYAPVLQEEPLLTEDLIKETEEFVLRTGSVGAGCSQLLSDMQAFKAANPGCILEDFVRWHSPPDWVETQTSDETKGSLDDIGHPSAKGQLSTRMQKEGNLWRELWESAKPIPAAKQAPLYDEDLAVEGALTFLEDISPADLFEQLFISLLGAGLVIAETALTPDETLCKLFNDCKDYVVATCQGGTWIEKVDDLCQVYETVQMMILNPDEVLRLTKQPEDHPTGGEHKGRFKKLSFMFGGKDRHGKTPPKDPKNSEDNPTRQSFSSLFSKKPPKPGSASPAEKPVSSVENEWTVV